jgi:hypothetical protein
MVDRRVPISISRIIRWLRKPSSFAVRLAVAILLILGGIFSFLPILGIWMLPLGLLLIAQDIPFLQKPLVAAFTWVEAKWKWLRTKWGSSTADEVIPVGAAPPTSAAITSTHHDSKGPCSEA